MITYEDIKKILESVDIAKLEKDYMTRQEVNLLDNTKKAKDVLAYFPDELIYLPKGLDNIGKLNALLMLYLNNFMIVYFYLLSYILFARKIHHSNIYLYRYCNYLNLKR